ncbi:MAG: hypothetical protein ACP5E3_13865 [Bacteroidales bacterium]
MVSKIAQIALYIVVGISVLVIGFFYFGDSLVDMDTYEAKIEKMSAPADGSAGFNFQADLAETDTAAVESDTTAVADTTAAGAEDTGGDMMEESAPVEEMTGPAEADTEEVSLTFMETLVFNKTDIALIWAYILVIITLIVALVFSLGFMFTNTKTLVRGLLILVGAAVLVGVAYMLGSDTPLQIIGYEGTDNKDPQVLKLVDMGLISTYFVLGLIVLTILYSEVAKYFK